MRLRESPCLATGATLRVASANDIVLFSYLFIIFRRHMMDSLVSDNIGDL